MNKTADGSSPHAGNADVVSADGRLPITAVKIHLRAELPAEPQTLSFTRWS